MRTPRSLLAAAMGALMVGSLLVATPASAAVGQPDDPSVAAEADLRRHSPGKVSVHRDERGVVRFVGAEADKPVARPSGVGAGAAAERKAAAHLSRYAPLWALDKKGADVRRTKTHERTGRGSVVRFQQTVDGMPVLGGELVVALDEAGNLQSVSGETTPLAMNAGELTVSANKARDTAVRVAARANSVPASALRAGAAEVFAYDPALLGPGGIPGLTPVWKIEVTGLDHVRHLVLVDRVRGGVPLHFNQVTRADRVVCDNANTRSSDNDCHIASSRKARAEGEPEHPQDQVNAAYDYVGHTAEFFENIGVPDFTEFVGSAAADGTKLRTTVRFCFPSSVYPACPMDNAFYNGRGVYLGSGYAYADDIVAHEYAHAVVEKTANLFYWYQSGAINESMADVFGELVDLTNGHDAGPSRPWLIGEDAPGGAIRSMINPPAFGHPDRMRSPLYASDVWVEDEGGVHVNNGVGNKAAYLIARPTEEGPVTFNGRTVTGVGYDKAARIYFETLLLLSSGADYGDLFHVLPQACANLAADPVNSITATDCQQVSLAVAATEMDKQPTDADARAPEAPLACTTNKRDMFFDGFEGTMGNWVRTRGMWPQIEGYAKSGAKSMHGIEPDRGSGEPTNTYARINKSFSIPRGAETYLRFDHSHFIAYWPGDAQFPREYWAGARVQYSTDGGSSWQSASSLPWHTSGAQPNKTITPYRTDGSIGTKYKAFGGDSHGYVSSQVDLTSLAGKSVQLRWRITADPDVFLQGWTMDNVNLYNCVADTPTNVRSVSVTGDVGKATVKWSPPSWPGTGGVTKYRITVAPGDKTYDVSPETRSRVITGLSKGVTYTFRVRAYSAAGAGPVTTKKLTGTKLTSSLSASTITYGASTTLRGKLTRVDTGGGLSKRTIALQGRKKGASSWKTVTTVQTGTGGSYSFTRKPSQNYEYRAVYRSGSTVYQGSTSSRRAVTVRMKVSATLSTSTVKKGTTVTLSGKVSPNHEGRTVYLQRYSGGKWNSIGSRKLNSSSNYSFSITASATYSYRVYAPGHGDHARGNSPSRKLTVT